MQPSKVCMRLLTAWNQGHSLLRRFTALKYLDLSSACRDAAFLANVLNWMPHLRTLICLNNQFDFSHLKDSHPPKLRRLALTVDSDLFRFNYATSFVDFINRCPKLSVLAVELDPTSSRLFSLLTFQNPALKVIEITGSRSLHPSMHEMQLLPLLGTEV